jgi:hypothetical protein
MLAPALIQNAPWIYRGNIAQLATELVEKLPRS